MPLLQQLMADGQYGHDGRFVRQHVALVNLYVTDPVTCQLPNMAAQFVQGIRRKRDCVT